MSRIILCFVFLTIIFSCAEETAEKSTVKVGLDETGMPIPCEMIADSFLLYQFPNATSLSERPEDIENNPGTMCSYQLLNENGQRIMQLVLIIKPRERNTSRREIANNARNTEYLEDLEFPATWRSFSNLKTLAFDYGNFTISLNLGVTKALDEKGILDAGKKIARHVVDNLEGSGIENN